MGSRVILCNLCIFVIAWVLECEGSAEVKLNEKEIAEVIANANKNVSSWRRKDFDDTLEEWEPPYNFSKLFPYYLSGYDEEHRPIWIAELGRWNVRGVVEAGEERVKAFQKYIRQSGLRAFKSIQNSPTPDYPGGEGGLIIDFDGLDFYQLYSIDVLTLFLRLGLEYRYLLTEHLGTIVVVNANYVATTLIRLARPVFGVFLERFEVFGSNKERWIPEILSRFPRDQIPPWYGGSKNFKPVKVYG